jgi:hypothetical protein
MDAALGEIQIEVEIATTLFMTRSPEAEAWMLKLVGDFRALPLSHDDGAALMIGTVALIIEGAQAAGAFADRPEGYVARLYDAVELAWRLADARAAGKLAGTDQTSRLAH